MKVRFPFLARSATARFPGLRRTVLAALAPLALVSCEPYSEIYTDFWDKLDRAPVAQRPVSDAWTAYPGISLVLEKSFGPVTEQRVLLPNPTAMPGDNFMLMIARERDLATIGRFRPAQIVERNGGAPSPFTDFSGQPQNSREDAFGWLHWSSWTSGTDLTCVLAFRRLDANARMTPRRTGAIDMMLRNCMRGTAEEALEPITDVYVGYAAVPGPVGASQRMLSPLAGPLP